MVVCGDGGGEVLHRHEEAKHVAYGGFGATVDEALEDPRNYLQYYL